MNRNNTLRKDTPNLPPPVAEERVVDANSFYDPYHKELESIAKIESAGHKNRIHDVNNSGMHKGMRSVSSFGIMPITAVEIAQKHSVFKHTETAKQLRNLGKNIQATHTDINKITENQELDKQIAGAVWDYQKNRVKTFVSDEKHVPFVVALAHRKGISAAKQIYLKGGIDDVMKHPYVSTFANHYKNISLASRLQSLRAFSRSGS